MKLFAPDYYRDFTCIADKCKHSCCIGWEIDIDEDTLEYYSALSGELGEKLRRNIDFENSCFKLCENDRCPFLNEKGLCEIIIGAGERALCQICHDHPRFRNFFSGRIEVGLGLCCEAAAKLILDKKSKTKLVLLDEDSQGEDLCVAEEELLNIRAQIFEEIENLEHSTEETEGNLLAICGSKLPKRTETEWAKIYLSLERLDESWTAILENIEDGDFEHGSTPSEERNLLWYFIYRHLSTALDDGLLKERAAFAVLSTKMIAAAAKQVGIYEAARLYSSEIEYSDENIEILLSALSTKESEQK